MIIIINDGDDDNIQVYHIIIRWGICNEKATISLPVLLGAKISKLSGRAWRFNKCLLDLCKRLNKILHLNKLSPSTSSQC